MQTHKEILDEYRGIMMRTNLTNTLTSIEMIFADREFATFSRELGEAAKGKPFIQLRLALTVCDRILQIREAREGSFNPDDVLPRVERMINMTSEEINKALDEFTEGCRRKYSTENA